MLATAVIAQEGAQNPVVSCLGTLTMNRICPGCSYGLQLRGEAEGTHCAAWILQKDSILVRKYCKIGDYCRITGTINEGGSTANWITIKKVERKR
jgi:hypothetical protein